MFPIIKISQSYQFHNSVLGLPHQQHKALEAVDISEESYYSVSSLLGKQVTVYEYT